MVLRWLLAFVHLVALGIGLGAVWTRARTLSGTLDQQGLRRAFAADAWWGIAAVLWISTGLFRAFGGLEKGTSYYLHNSAFLTKMGLLMLVLALEVWPMTTLIRWRVQQKRGGIPNLAASRTMARISYAQTALVILMVLAATAMARGLGTQ